MGRSKKSQAKKREKQKKVTELKKKKLKEKKTDRGGASKENTRVQTEPAKTRPSTGVSKYTVEQLLQKAEEYIDTLDYELALKFCQRALEVDENRVQALETAGTVYIELGDAESALKYFNRAVTLSPNNGFSKYMYLGQLNEGKQAIECFQKGVELMLKDREDGKEALEGACANPEETTTVSDRDISRAYCSMAEIYLTDSCFEEDAEQHCKDCLDKAIEADTDNAEAHQLLASYLLSINNPEDAKTAIEKSLSLWLPQWREHLEKSEVSEAFELCPLSYEVRISTAKILIELQLFLEAIEV
ncbi:uncharacterized protein [Ptychodera flava]|uniref:uncharacterized protein n=1 Tax=Ptychodera flava TaxID=63121 RepID=UPI00396A3DFC